MNESNNRIFSEEEVGRLLRSAIKQQEEDSEAKYNADHGMTLEEVSRIAAEAGIDAKYIRRALLNLDIPEEEVLKPGFWGIPNVIEYKSQIPGLLNEDAMQRILGEIRETFKNPRGQFNTLKNSFEWTNQGSTGNPVLVQVQPVDGKTNILIRERQDNPLVLSYLLPFMFGPIALIATLVNGQYGGFAFILAAFLAIFMGIRWLLWKHYQKRHKVLTELRDTIHTAIEENQEKAWSYADVSDTSAPAKLSLDGVDTYSSESTSDRTSKKTKT